MWVAQSVTANLLFPLVWAAFAPHQFWNEASRLPVSHWLVSYGWGLLWGAGGVSYGIVLTRLGMAFANAFIFGITIISGALLPLAMKAVSAPVAPAYFAAGLILCILSTALLGFFRGRGQQESMLAMPFPEQTYRKALALAAISGVLSAGYGLAFTFQYAALRAIASAQVSPLSASLAVLLPVYLGGASVAIPTGLYYAKRSRSLSLFVKSRALRNWMLAMVMGLFAAATAICYNLGAASSGHPSPNVAFAIFLTFLVLGGIVFGYFTGEMRGNSGTTNRGLLLSSCGLVLAAWLLHAR